ncbi:MAG: YhcH/YjgK/YiaL family protein [Candidatus Nealsonbacteria bacterium]|nr:YhcH/YjgK/YiaL family protein [Candidatus Nealsonbacteria bacterium]
MIKGKLEDFDIESSDLQEKTKKALKFLKSADFSSLGKERKPIVEGESFIFCLEYQTQKPKDKAAELHKKKADIHYIISGKEKIGIAKENPGNKAKTDYNEEDDYILYDFVENEEFFPLEAGEFMVMMPGEIHRPGCDFDGTESIKKAIIKIIF